DGRHVEQRSDPRVHRRMRRRHVEQIDERRPHDERQHQQHVRVEGEPDGSGDADGPLQRRQARGRVRLNVRHMVYRSSVADEARDAGVRDETTNISSADTIVIGTTGSKPNTVVPAAIRATTVVPPGAQTGTAAPGGGAGTTDCSMATPATAAAVHSVTARAPHFVLPLQKSAATSSGDSAEYPANADGRGKEKNGLGRTSAARETTKARKST